MTDTSQAQPVPQPAPAPKPERFVKLKIMFGLKPDPTGRPSFIWLERWNSFIVAFCVGAGVPLIALSNLGIATKLVILSIWLFIYPKFYTYFEGREVYGQMQGRGALDTAQASNQMSSAQAPYWGVVFAFILWIVVLAVHITSRLMREYDSAAEITSILMVVQSSFRTTPLQYGLIEWWILVDMVWATCINNQTWYNIITEFLKATPRAERSDRRIPNG